MTRYPREALKGYGRALVGAGSLEDVGNLLPPGACPQEWVDGLPRAYLRYALGRLSNGELAGLAVNAAALLTESGGGKASE